MSKGSTTFGFFGIGFGGVALLFALVHFWAGPFTPAPTLETTIADKVSSIRSATINALKGEEYKKINKTSWDTDKVIYVVTALLGGLALIFSIVSLAKHEPKRVAIGGAILGISAVAFQFFAMYLMVILVVLLICSALSSVGIYFE